MRAVRLVRRFKRQVRLLWLLARIERRARGMGLPIELARVIALAEIQAEDGDVRLAQSLVEAYRSSFGELPVEGTSP